MIINGNNITLEMMDKSLKLTITDTGKELLEDIGMDEINFLELFEDIQVNSSFSFLPSVSELGALSEAPGIIYEYELTDSGEFVENEDSRLFYYNDYMLNNFVEELFNDGVVTFKEYIESIHEGIDYSKLSEEQKKYYDELKTSNTELFDERDFEFYADKIGVSLIDLMEAFPNTGTESMGDTDKEEIMTFVKERLIDNESVNTVNINDKIYELAMDLYVNYDWGDKDFDAILACIKDCYKELTTVENQLEIPFTEKRKFVMKFEKFCESNSVSDLANDIAIDLLPKISIEKDEKGGFTVDDLEKFMSEKGAKLDLIDDVISELVSMGFEFTSNEIEVIDELEIEEPILKVEKLKKFSDFK